MHNFFRISVFIADYEQNDQLFSNICKSSEYNSNKIQKTEAKFFDIQSLVVLYYHIQRYTKCSLLYNDLKKRIPNFLYKYKIIDYLLHKINNVNLDFDKNTSIKLRISRMNQRQSKFPSC